MVDKVIYTFWESSTHRSNAGYRNTLELAQALALSMEQSKKQFARVELVTNKYGKELLIDKYKLPFTNVQVELDHLDSTLSLDFWAYVKIYAYSIQKEPFINLDLDVILWDRIPDSVLSAELAFQNKELLKDHGGYMPLNNRAMLFPKMDIELLLERPDWAYNCGIVLANNLDVIKEWKKVVDEYLFSPENETAWLQTDKWYQNHFCEQYFISCIIKRMNLQGNVKTLLKDDFNRSALQDFKMTHCWGGVKRQDDIVNKIKTRLLRDYPQYEYLENA